MTDIISYILGGIAIGLLAVSSVLFVKYTIEFMKLVKERDGYYLFKTKRWKI